MKEHAEPEPLEYGRQPLAITALLKAGVRLIARGRRPYPEVEWSETALDMCARFLVGLVIGIAFCVLLVPCVFWPGRRGRSSLFEQLGEPKWIYWTFPGVIIGTALFWALTTRVTLRADGSLQGFIRPICQTCPENRIETIGMGIVLPLIMAAYGVHKFLHPWTFNRITGISAKSDYAAALGICIVGVALCVHAFGFVPYARTPVVKYLLAGGGVALFVFGLSWPSVH